MTINMELRRFYFLTVGKLFNNVYLSGHSQAIHRLLYGVIYTDAIFVEINKFVITVQRLVSKLIQENIETAFILQL